MEMSTLNEYLPRYYKGFDVDNLIRKMDNGISLDDKERRIICEVQHIYLEKQFKENREKWKKEHPEGYRTHFDRSMIKR